MQTAIAVSGYMAVVIDFAGLAASCGEVVEFHDALPQIFICG